MMPNSTKIKTFNNLLSRKEWVNIKLATPFLVRYQLEKKGLDKYINDFIRIMNLRRETLHYDEVRRVLTSRRIIELIIDTIKSMIDPMDNDFIKEYSKQYIELVDNIGRWAKRTDSDEAYNINKISGGTYHLADFNEQQILAYETFVLKVFRNAVNSFNEVKDEYEKDFSLFTYYIFRELVYSFEVLGAITREKYARKGVTLEHQYQDIPTLPSNIEKRSDDTVDFVIDNHIISDEDLEDV